MTPPVARSIWIQRPIYDILFNPSTGEIKRTLGRFKRTKLEAGLLPLDFLRISGGIDTPDAPGVYFLWRGPALLYIGKSKSLWDRIERHTRIRDDWLPGKEIPFTRHTFIVCKKDEIGTLETRYILAYWPPYNDKAN